MFKRLSRIFPIGTESIFKINPIIEELPKLRVMVRDSKMLGVINGNFGAGAIKIEWIAIHPLYPEEQLREAMIKGVYAIYGLDRGKEERALSNCEVAPGLE